MNHHAVVYVGDAIDSCHLPEVAQVASADVVHISADRLSIDAVRALKADAFVQPLVASVRTFVVAAREWPPEAQNAFLKLLEEPPSSATFMLVVPRVDVLLPTVRSRVLVASGHEHTPTNEASTTFTAFKAAPYAMRLDMIAAWAKDKSTDEMESVLRGAENVARECAVANPKLLAAVVGIRNHFGQSGAARKMLLEELALCLPLA
jgi:hypothetical protein